MAVLAKKVERPRDLSWYHASAMLYGDWGTSKAYVLGIAFALAGHASWFLLGLMSLLAVMVGLSFITICRLYPDGGGVYSACKARSQTLGVIGALLLIAGYVVTASLSALAAFHYFNFPRPELWAIAAILIIGAVNWVGPTKSGTIAVVFGILASLAALTLLASTLPSLPNVRLHWPEGGVLTHWSHFVGVVLALSGAEAIANMTGVMKEPVGKTSRKAIIPVFTEVALVTFLLGIAMNAIPGLAGHTEDMLRVLGTHYIGDWYGEMISVIFGLLLLSAVNTAIVGLVGVQYAMAKDRELPDVFAQLNRFGMPSLSLIVAVAVPVIVLIVESDLLGLASLYAIGVVGAILLDLGASATNWNIRLSRFERILLLVTTAVLLLIEITIAVEKLNALIFAIIIVGSGLVLRAVAKVVVPVPMPEALASMNVLTVSEAKEIVPLYKSSSLVGLEYANQFLLDEAALRVKAKGENAVYIINVEQSPATREFPTELEPSRKSLELLAEAQRNLERKGVTAVPIWRVGAQPAKLIAAAARELKVSTVMIGTTHRTALTRLLRGDVVRILSKSLPRKCHLVISG